MSILKSKLLIRILSLALSVLSVLSLPTKTVSDVFEASLNGWFLKYSAEERADMISEMLLRNERETFEEETAVYAKEIIHAVILQFADGNADSDAVTDVLKKLPREDKVREETKTYDSVLSPETVRKIASVFEGDIRGIVEGLGMGIHDLYVYFGDTEYDGIDEFKGSYVDCEGTVHYVNTGVYYDTVSGMVYGKNNDGVFGIGYDYDAKQYMLQNPVDCWMRNMGYNIGYDILGKLTFMNTGTKRIKFEACGKEWMIQVWKGNYTVLSNGAEIGLYYLEDGKHLSYTCADDEDMPVMEMSIRNGDDVLFERGATTHWWLSAFQIGPAVYHKDMTLNAKITFNTEEMSDAFSKALIENGITPETEGTAVSFSWK